MKKMIMQSYNHLYIYFDPADKDNDNLSVHLKDISIPNYTFSDYQLKDFIKAPGETKMPVKFVYYAENDFRIYVSEVAIEFYRGTIIPLYLLEGERFLQSKLLNIPGFQVRRWIMTNEYYDDEDNFKTEIIAEGNQSDTLINELNSRKVDEQ